MLLVSTIIILLILTPILSLPGFFLVKLLLPLFKRVGVWLTALILAPALVFLYILILLVLGLLYQIFIGEETSYIINQSASLGLGIGTILGYFLSFYGSSFRWLFRIPSFHSNAGFFSAIFFALTWIFPLLLIFYIDSLYLSASSSSAIRNIIGSREGLGYVGIGLMMTAPFGLVIGPILSIIMKNLIPPSFSEQQGQLAGTSNLSQNFLFRRLESFSLLTKAGILLSAYSIISAFIDKFSYNWTIRLFNPSYWVAAATPIPELFPLVQIIALTFLVIVVWKRFGTGRFSSDRSRILALLGAIVVYALFVFLFVFLLGGFIQF